MRNTHFEKLAETWQKPLVIAKLLPTKKVGRNLAETLPWEVSAKDTMRVGRNLPRITPLGFIREGVVSANTRNPLTP